MGRKHNLIVTAKNTLSLDCMGTIVKIDGFCRKRFPKDNKYTRGFVNSKMKEVTCEFGSHVFVSIGCDKKDKKFCIRPQVGCRAMKKVFAKNLDVSHVSFVEKDVDNVLNCFFEAKKESEEDLISNPLKL